MNENKVIRTKYGSEVTILELLEPFNCLDKSLERVLVLFEKNGSVSETNVQDLQPSEALENRLADLKMINKVAAEARKSKLSIPVEQEWERE